MTHDIRCVFANSYLPHDIPFKPDRQPLANIPRFTQIFSTHHQSAAVMPSINITRLSASPDIVDMLSDILVEVVASGGSVSFMHPLAPATAQAFWHDSLALAATGKRLVIGAWDGDALVGTVTVLLDCPLNQPHRTEIAKLMMRISHRGKASRCN